MADPKQRPETEEQFGVGMNDNGTVNTLTPAQYQQALIDRQAEEEVEDEQPEDFADLVGDAQ